MLNYVRILNLVLIVVMGILGYSLYTHWKTGGEIRPDVAEVVERNVRKGQPVTQSPLQGLLNRKQESGFSAYQDIVDKNLFTSDRKNITDDKGEAGEDEKAAGKNGPIRFTLYGIAVNGDERLALIGYQGSDPTTRKRFEKVRMVKVGDKVEGNKVVEIDETSLKLESGGESLLLKVYDAKEPGVRRQERTAQAVRNIPPPSVGQTSGSSAQPQTSAPAPAAQPQAVQPVESRTSAFVRNKN